MPAKNIFICYRRDDAEGYAGRLYDRLNSRFPGRVFMDVTGISPGADFSRVIQDTVGSCHVLIAIIGRHWTTVTDASNRRRLDLADDYVRHEIATALIRNITVIPVLVRGAEMPSREVLPADLAALSTRNALEITDGDFDHDVQRLIEVLENECGEARPLPTSQIQPGRSNCLIFAVIGILALGAIVVVLFLLGILAASSQSSQSVVEPSSQPEYSPAPSAERQPPSTEPSVAEEDDVVNFHPVGHWILTFEENGRQVHQDLVLHGNGINGIFESGEQTGRWDYSTDEGTLTLEGRLEITIESQQGNAFVGHGQIGDDKFPVRLTRN